MADEVEVDEVGVGLCAKVVDAENGFNGIEFVLDEAMGRRSWQEFDPLIAATIEASDRYHAEWGYDYIRYRIPGYPPSDYLLPPPEDKAP